MFFRCRRSRRAPRATPTPPWVIPDWRRFQRDHPKSSQIGVDFSASGLIGVGLLACFTAFCLCLSARHPPYPLCSPQFHPRSPNSTQESAEGRKPIFRIFRLKANGYVLLAKFSMISAFHTLRRCHTIALFFARINCESGHVLGKSVRLSHLNLAALSVTCNSGSSLAVGKNRRLGLTATESLLVLIEVMTDPNFPVFEFAYIQFSMFILNRAV